MIEKLSPFEKEIIKKWREMERGERMLIIKPKRSEVSGGVIEIRSRYYLFEFPVDNSENHEQNGGIDKGDLIRV